MTGKDDQGQPIYDVPNWSWSEPATVFQDPPFHIPDGGGFKFTCTWNNTSDQTVPMTVEIIRGDKRAREIVRQEHQQ